MNTLPLEFIEQCKRKDALAQKLLKQNPLLGITAFVMAGDLLSCEIADKQLKDGVPFLKASKFVGSFFRLDWMLRRASSKTRKNDLFCELPETWSGSDPNDTDR